MAAFRGNFGVQSVYKRHVSPWYLVAVYNLGLQKIPIESICSLGLPLRCCNLARGHGALGARCADHHHRLAPLVFRRQSHLVAGEVQGDRPGLSCRGEIQRTPVDGDLARADAEKPAEVDDGRVNLAVAAHDDVHDPAHVLVGAAANALAEDGGDLLVVEDRRRRAGGGVGGRGGGRWGRRRRCRILRPDLYRRPRRSLRRLRELPRLSWSRCPLRQAIAMDTRCRDQRNRNDSGKYQTDTHQCSPPCAPTRNLNATAALRFQVRSARQDGTAGRSILSDWQINGRARGERATLRIPSLMRFLYRRPGFPLENICENGQISRNDVLSLGH